jgi:hypothetical protein
MSGEISEIICHWINTVFIKNIFALQKSPNLSSRDEQCQPYFVVDIRVFGLPICVGLPGLACLIDLALPVWPTCLSCLPGRPYRPACLTLPGLPLCVAGRPGLPGRPVILNACLTDLLELSPWPSLPTCLPDIARPTPLRSRPAWPAWSTCYPQCLPDRPTRVVFLADLPTCLPDIARPTSLLRQAWPTWSNCLPQCLALPAWPTDLAEWSPWHWLWSRPAWCSLYVRTELPF